MFPNPQDALPLPPRPNLEQYKKLAKDLLRATKSQDEKALRDWASAWVQDLLQLSSLNFTQRTPVRARRWSRQVAEFAHKKLGKDGKLSDAQFVIARSHGFLSWPKFVKHVEESMTKHSAEAQFEAAADAIVTGDI